MDLMRKLSRGPMGVAGLNLGVMFPVAVLALNAVWGLVASWWYQRAS